MKYPVSKVTRFLTCVSVSFPNVDGVIANVYEIPSSEYSYGSFATELSAATAPFTSLPCSGFAPGPNGSPALLPSGVLPVALPYTTLDVIVSTERVCLEPLYVTCLSSFLKNVFTRFTAISSTLSSSFPYLGKSPSIS